MSRSYKSKKFKREKSRPKVYIRPTPNVSYCDYELNNEQNNIEIGE